MEIKKYLPINIKKQLCDEIIKNSLVERDGMLFIDFIAKELATDLALVSFYTDIKLEEVGIDSLYDNNTMEDIKKKISGTELYFIKSNVNSILEQEKEVHNSLSATVARSLDKISEKIPEMKDINKLIPKLSKELSKISPDTLNMLKDISVGKVKA